MNLLLRLESENSFVEGAVGLSRKGEIISARQGGGGTAARDIGYRGGESWTRSKILSVPPIQID